MRALVISYSQFEFDNRVQESLEALRSIGYEVVAIGFSGANSRAIKFIEVPSHSAASLFSSIGSLALGWLTGNFNLFYRARPWIRETARLLEQNSDGDLTEFDLVLIHDWEALPLIAPKFPLERIYLDCHEFSLDESVPRVLRRSFLAYKSWLIRGFDHPEMNHATVSKSVKEAYESELDSIFQVISNHHGLQDLDPSSNSRTRLQIGFAGTLDWRRGGLRLACLALLLHRTVSFNFFFRPIDGLANKILALLMRSIPNLRINLSLSRRSLVHQLAKCDYGLYFEGRDSRNAQLALPNKIFEYSAAGIPVIAQADSLVGRIVEETAAGATVEGSIIDLALRIKSIQWTEAEAARHAMPKLRAKLRKMEAGSKNYTSWLSN